MKALTYSKFGSADELQWTEGLPVPELTADSVLIKVIAGGVNPKDVLLRKGKFSKTLARGPLPKISGLDVAGEIIEVGAKVTDLSVGELVFGMTNNFAGGAHAEVAKLYRSEVASAPANISIEEASCVPLAAQTALQALRDCCNLKPGQRVLINGASGGVGHFAVQIAKAMGAEVHSVCGSGNVQFVKSLGSDKTYSYEDQPAQNIVHSFDAVFDVFGKLSRADFAQQLGGKGVYVSTVPNIATLFSEAVAQLRLSKRSRLVRVHSCTDDLEQLKEWIEGGLLMPHVEKIFSVEKASEAHRHIESKHTIGKICISF